MIPWLIAAGLCLMVAERLFPDQTLAAVPGWWRRVIGVNLLQLGVVLLGARTWDVWLLQWSMFDLDARTGVLPAAVICYLLITLVFYWWHRLRHDLNPLWLAFHQVHHSPARIETITSFYKHPLEILVNSLIIGVLNHVILGCGPETAALVTLITGLAEFFYHMNIPTPRWVGYIIQRPEMHRIHHKRGYHYKNFADLPLWDMLFGTFHNPPRTDTPCGFRPERETRLVPMLLFQNVNDPLPRRRQAG